MKIKSSASQETAAAQLWYTVPAVWIVIGIPVFSVITTLCFVWISVQTFDGVVVDDYYRKGLQINRDLARDRYAATKGIEAFGEIAAGRLRLQFSSDVIEVWPDRLPVSFYHPTVSNRDVAAILTYDGDGQYSAADLQLDPGKWNIVTETESWRLRGNVFHPSPAGFELRPPTKPNVGQ